MKTKVILFLAVVALIIFCACVFIYHLFNENYAGSFYYLAVAIVLLGFFQKDTKDNKVA